MNGTNEHETNLDWSTRAVINHLGDYAIKGVIIRQDVNNLVVEARLSQAENDSLRKQLASERALIKRFVDSMALLEVELLKERALRKELVEVYEQWVKLNRIPNSLIHRFTPLINKSKSLDEKK